VNTVMKAVSQEVLCSVELVNFVSNKIFSEVQGTFWV
jgi:hypothetical protein